MEQFVNIFNNSNTITMILLQLLMMVTVSIIPFAPIPVLVTLVGTHHSFLIAFCINLLGTLTGSVILYQLSKSMSQRRMKKTLNKFDQLQNFKTLIQTNGFLAVLIGRLVPILPSAGVNIMAGISGVTFIAFATATLLGKIPIILAFSLAGNQLADGNWYTLTFVGLYIFVLILIGGKVKKRWKT